MRIVIVGGGLAAATAATELRDTGFEGEVAVFAAEPHEPYERPPLSKAVLMGDKEPASVYCHDRQWYADNDVDLHTGERVVAVDREARTITTDSGATTSYDALLLATGAQPRHLPDADAAGAVYLRTIDDSAQLKSRLNSGTRVIVIGGGWIGLEVTSAARNAGAEVTVIEMADLPLQGVLGDEIAAVFADLHREHDVDLRLGATITGFDRVGESVVVHTDGGDVEGDLLVVGIGVVPDSTLAEEAGLDVDNGVLVDATLRTSDEHIWAVGDLASHDHPVLGRLRVEHWDNAIEQAKVAAHNLAGGSETYDRAPYFFTDQYDLGMEYVGRAGRGDEVVTRGDVPGRVFQAYWLHDGIVSAAMQVNDWDSSDVIRAAVGKPFTG
ncbi:FAD-dependent oxidoreductase [Nocardioides sp. InS609-2]|uniref:NAD(P)/FAD-dependent oxidoreductase n=1 Tax=Nocardioides sp. InS609-2 TaxID=2760705 RepID=UPI0020C0433D|nr:FAD-dependent oxidoreductase [Nocardioides sp. InS609-2]